MLPRAPRNSAASCRRERAGRPFHPEPTAWIRLNRIHSVQIRVPHAKSATGAKKLERYARKTSRQTVNGVSVDKMPTSGFPLAALA